MHAASHQLSPEVVQRRRASLVDKRRWEAPLAAPKETANVHG